MIVMRRAKKMILLNRLEVGATLSAEQYTRRIKEHLEHRNTPVVHLIWRGHLQAVLEWGFISQETFDEVLPILETTDYAESKFPFFAELQRDPKTGMEIIPDSAALDKVVSRSVYKNDEDERVQLLWHGYLAGLQEHIGFEGFVYSFHLEGLDDLASDEIGEMFIGFERD